jgi:hypothetical protein
MRQRPADQSATILLPLRRDGKPVLL